MIMGNRRAAIPYGIAGLGLCVVVFLCFQMFHTPVLEIDPHPKASAWDYFYGDEDRPATPNSWVNGRGGICKKTMLIELDFGAGFGSSFQLLMLPGLSMARHYGYTAFIDDRKSNYGRLTDYLEPMQLDCQLPDDWDTVERVLYPAEGWEKADHVRINRFALVPGYDPVAAIDDFWRDNYMTYGQSKAIAALDAKALVNGFATLPYLPSEMSFCQAIRPSFRVAYKTATEFLRLNKMMRGEVEKLVQITRPARREGIPVLGAHIRLGDKVGEAGWNPGANAYGNYNGYAETLREQRALLVAGRNLTSKPILMVMTDDVQSAMQGLRSVLAEDEFDLRAIDTAIEIMPLPETDDRYVAPATPALERRAHYQTDFNNQPILQRISLARTFIRDLYYISKYTDSLAVSSTSNVGRMALLLAGEEKAYGSLQPSENALQSIGGLSRSVDTRWFPCVFYAGCYRDE